MTAAAGPEAAENLREQVRPPAGKVLSPALAGEDLPPRDQADVRPDSSIGPNARAGPPPADAEGPSRAVI